MEYEMTFTGAIGNTHFVDADIIPAAKSSRVLERINGAGVPINSKKQKT
jgi:hypothetical protein